MHEAGDVKAVFIGHDHVNDFCGDFQDTPIKTCYVGGAGYHAYGKASWPRRARLVLASLQPSLPPTPPPPTVQEPEAHHGTHLHPRNSSPHVANTPSLPQPWHGVHSISTWKCLDDVSLSRIDRQLLYSPTSPSLWAPHTTCSFLIFISLFPVFFLIFAYAMSWWPFHRLNTHLPISLCQRSLFYNCIFMR